MPTPVCTGAIRAPDKWQFHSVRVHTATSLAVKDDPHMLWFAVCCDLNHVVRKESVRPTLIDLQSTKTTLLIEQTIVAQPGTLAVWR